MALAGLASDPDGQALAYTWTQTSGTTVTLDGPNVPTLHFVAPSAVAASQLGFQLSVSDGALIATGTVTVSVNAQNVGPTVNVIPDLSASEDAAFSYPLRPSRSWPRSASLGHRGCPTCNASLHAGVLVMSRVDLGTFGVGSRRARVGKSDAGVGLGTFGVGSRRARLG